MYKVLVVDWLGGKILLEGETDGKRVDKEYVRVRDGAGGSNLYHIAAVYADVPAFRTLFFDRTSQIKELKHRADTLLHQSLNDARAARIDLHIQHLESSEE